MDHDLLASAATSETHELHVFFQQWLAGELPKSPEAFGRLEAALDQDFSVVAPSGVRSDRASVTLSIWDAHGVRGKSDPPFRISIENEALIFVVGAVVAIGYDECQSISGKPTRRRSTAVFRTDAGGPNGLRWAALHETWVQAP